jgi:hypothetical protein
MTLENEVVDSKPINYNEFLQNVVDRVISQYKEGEELDLDHVLAGHRFNDERDALMAHFAVGCYNILSNQSELQRELEPHIKRARRKYLVEELAIAAGGISLAYILTGSLRYAFSTVVVFVIAGAVDLLFRAPKVVREEAFNYAHMPHRRKEHSFTPEQLIEQTVPRLAGVEHRINGYG